MTGIPQPLAITLAGELRVRLVEERALLPLSADEWNGLVARNEINTVFQTFEWFDAWWNALGPEHRLFFLVVQRGESVVGFAAFMLTRVGAGINQLEFVGTGNADYQDIVAPPEDKAQAVEVICAFLRDCAPRWQRAWLCNIPNHASTLSHLDRACRRLGLHLVHEATMPCPAMRLDGEGQHAARRQIDKYSLRRPLNRFARRGAVRFRHVGELAEVRRLLPAFFDQHIRRWQAAGKGSLFTDPRQREFYASLAQAAHGRGWLLFSVVELDGEPIAFHFGFDYERNVIWYKPSFEVKYAEHSPGLLLIRQLIDDALERERRAIDFTIGGEPFKERFANEYRHNVYLGLYRSRSMWLAGSAVRNARRIAGRLLRPILPKR